MNDLLRVDLLSEIQAMGGLPKCPYCGGKHVTKKEANACTDQRRKTFRELDACMAKILSKKKPA